MSSGNYSEGIDLQQYWMTLKRHWLPVAIVFGSTVGLAAGMTLFQKPVYQGQGKLLLKVDSLSRLTGINTASDLKVDTTNSINNEVEVLRSAPIAEQTINALRLKNKAGETLTVQEFLKNLDVKAIRSTDAISIAYKSSRSQEAAAVVNELMRIYLERNRLVNRAETIAAREFIEKQLPENRRSVQQASETLADFKRRNRFLTVDDEAKSFSGSIQELEKQINEARGGLANARAKAVSFRERLKMEVDQAIVLGSLSQSEGVQKTLAELQNIQNQLVLAQARYSDEAPSIKLLKEKEANLRKLLKDRIAQSVGEWHVSNDENLQLGKIREDLIGDFVKVEAERLGFERQLSDLINQYNSYRQRAVSLANLEQMQRQLQLNLNAAQSAYELLLKNLQEIKIAENQNIGNAQIIETATAPKNPVSPKKLVNLMAGAAAGLILGIITAFILDKRDSTIKTAQEATTTLGYTLLGIIPDFQRSRNYLPKLNGGNLSSLPVYDFPRSYISETYRTLFTTLQFLESNKMPKIVAITSAVPGEGKTTIAANLALAASEVCDKTLLIDADMRRPSQHLLFKVSNSCGFSDVLTNQSDFQDAITRINGLDVLTVGDIPTNPVVLLKSKQMTALLGSISQLYDFIVIDTPPLLVSADASIISKLVDGVLLVVRPGVLPRQSAVRAQELLNQSKQNVLGQVLNAVSPTGDEINYVYYDQSYDNSIKSQRKVRIQDT